MLMLDVDEIEQGFVNSIKWLGNIDDDGLLPGQVFSVIKCHYNMEIMCDDSKTVKRYYHNFEHISNCLSILDRDREELGLSDDEFFKLYMAILGHDMVYGLTTDDNKPSNEVESANSMAYALCLYTSHWDDRQNEIIEDVKNLIEATDHFKSYPVEDNLSQIICDIDLIGLGLDWPTYKNNGLMVQMEYVHFTDEAFLNGRINFLEYMLKRRVYQTDFYYKKYEHQARENMMKELNRLKGK